MSYLNARCARRNAIFAILLLLPSSWVANAHAAEDCADTPQKLSQYLSKAETLTGAYKIKLVQGQYALPGPARQWAMSASVTMEGGYSAMCAERLTLNPEATTINSSALGAGPSFLSNSLNVSGLQFVGGARTEFAPWTLDTSTLKLAHVRFTQTIPVLDVQDGVLNADNILADHAPADPVDHCAFNFNLLGDSTAKVKFTTVATSGGDVCIYKASTEAHASTVNIYNSVFWPDPLHVSAASAAPGDAFVVDVTNSLFGNVVDEFGSFTEHNSVHSDPLWVNPAAGSYALQVPPAPISPAINVGAGAADIPGGISDAETDIVGNPRIIGGIPDMGAYESAVDDSAVFKVTNTTDCSTPLNQPSCGSLRDAVARAASLASTAPVKFVEFAIKDASNQPMCPANIHLIAGLPDILTNVVIDGYTQGGIDQSNPPLSWVNTDPYIFNAHLCVNVMGPGSDYALRVPSGSNGSLTLRGVAMGGFSQGVMLLGGANHQIVGNEFGGIPNGFGYYGFSSAAVRVDTGAPVIVGGSNPADRNVFLNAFSSDNSNAAGTIVGYSANGAPGSCQIVGNLFGVPSDGHPAYLGNENGLLIQGGGCNVLGNQFGDNTKDAIRLMGGSHNVIQYNVIGPGRFGGDDFYNPGAGIRITNGANDNVIGGGDGFVGSIFDYQNIIIDMDAGGIVVSNSTGNAIRGNAIFGNGLTTNLNIDLGGDGPTPNDPGDTDGGVNSANDLMNFPVPHAVAWDISAPPEPGSFALKVSGYLDVPVGGYEIDAYYDTSCSPTSRGGGSWVGEAYYAPLFPGAGAFSLLVYLPISGYDPANGRLSLTATSIDAGGHHSTSEFSQCLSIDTIFSNGFER
jgi:hypothetical protein